MNRRPTAALHNPVEYQRKPGRWLSRALAVVGFQDHPSDDRLAAAPQGGVRLAGRSTPRGVAPDERGPRRHLDACDGCRTFLDQMRQTIRAIGHISHEPITARRRDEVLAIFRVWRSERR